MDDFFDVVGKEAGVSPIRGQGELEVPITEKIISTVGASRWAISEGIYWGVAASTDNLPPGLYSCGFSHNIGPYMESRINDTDELLHMPDSEAENVLAEIVEFTKLKKAFTNHGFLYKRGILLWGPPGSGKTCTLQLLIRLIINKLSGVAVFIDDPRIAVSCLTLLRKIEKERQVIAILEDLDSLVRIHGEAEYLSMLDGESQINDIIYVATTNYPERLDRRFVDRPSRFDTIKFIGMPSDIAREHYIVSKAPGIKDIKKHVSKTKGYSIAHLRELIILTQCFKRPFDESIAKLDKMIRRQPTSDDSPEKPSFGFIGDESV